MGLHVGLVVYKRKKKIILLLISRRIIRNKKPRKVFLCSLVDQSPPAPALSFTTPIDPFIGSEYRVSAYHDNRNILLQLLLHKYPTLNMSHYSDNKPRAYFWSKSLSAKFFLGRGGGGYTWTNVCVLKTLLFVQAIVIF